MKKVPMPATMYTKKSAPEISSEEDTYICKHNKKVSKKVFNFIVDVCNELKNTRIELKSENINIFVSNYDLAEYRKSDHYIFEDYLSIHIYKDRFYINKYSNAISSGRTENIFYKDDKLFKKVLPIAIEIVSRKTKENTIKMLDEVLVKSKIMRKNNLDKLLK